MPQIEVNFQGGYATDRPPEHMEQGMLLTAQNCYWENGLQGRGGKLQWSDLTTYDDQRGMIRAYINGAFHTIIAVENSAVIKFYRSTDGSSWTQIGSKTWTKDKDVHFDIKNDKIVAVNGTDFPVIIYYDGGWLIEDLDTHDTRTRGNADWVAGQYTAIGEVYTDDTTDAQDAGTSDFDLATTTNNDGFYVASNFVFTKLTLTNVDTFTGSPVAAYEYYKGGGVWGNLTMETTPVWTSGASHDLIFAWPSDWTTWDGSEDFAGKYIIRVRFTTAPSNTPNCDLFAVFDTHKLRRIMNNAIPHLVILHNSSIWLFEGNNGYFSVATPNLVKGWELYQSDYFLEGGRKIVSVASGENVLYVLKTGGIHGLYGNQFETAVKRFISDKGTDQALSSIVYDNKLWFLGTDGLVRAWDGKENVPISKHIRSDIAGFTITGCCTAAYKGRIWMSFPSESTILVWDPDSFRRDTDGDGVVSFYKQTAIRADRIEWWSDDDKKLYCLDRTAELIIELETANGWDLDSAATVDFIVKPRRMQAGAPQTKKRWGRLRVDISASGAWTFDMEADDGATSSTGFQIASGTGGGHYEQEIGPVPYELDGRDFTFQLRNNTVNRPKVYLVVLDPKRRKY